MLEVKNHFINVANMKCFKIEINEFDPGRYKIVLRDMVDFYLPIPCSCLKEAQDIEECIYHFLEGEFDIKHINDYITGNNKKG